MDALFYGSGEDAFFDFDSIAKNRKIKYPMLPESVSYKVQSPSVKIPQKQKGEIRLMSADIALMSSRKNLNDATAIFINQLMPTKAGRYTSNIVFPDSYEGLRTDDQALIIRKLFDEYACDYLILDTNGRLCPFVWRHIECSAEKTGRSEMITRVEGLCLKPRSHATHRR